MGEFMTPNEIKDGWYWCRAPWSWEVVKITTMPFRKKMQRMVLALVWKDTLDNFLKCDIKLVKIEEPREYGLFLINGGY
jgi:hypothetical protein